MPIDRRKRRIFASRLRSLRGSTIIPLGGHADSSGPVTAKLAQLIFRDQANQIVENIVLPLKDVRWQQLVEEGFNCADFRSWPRGKLNTEELFTFWKKHGRISLRNFKEEKLLDPTPQLPVAYDQNDWAFIRNFCEKHNQSFHTLVNEALPLPDSELAGKILLREKRYVIYCCSGHTTPRSLDDGSAKQILSCEQDYGFRAPDWIPEAIMDLVERLRSFRPDFRPMIVEFSFYPYPVGTLKEKVIFWEWRGGYATS